LENLTGVGPASPTAPPAYNELYPNQAQNAGDEDFSLKKASAIHAAAEAALEHHFDAVKSFSVSHNDGNKASEEQHEIVQNSVRRSTAISSRQYILFLVVSALSFERDFELTRAKVPILVMLLALMWRVMFLHVKSRSLSGSWNNVLQHFYTVPLSSSTRLAEPAAA
jgi:hypothetical protein